MFEILMALKDNLMTISMRSKIENDDKSKVIVIVAGHGNIIWKS